MLRTVKAAWHHLKRLTLAGVHASRCTLSLTWGDAWQNAICTFSHLILVFSSFSVFFLSLPCHISPHLFSICFPLIPLHVFLSVLLSGTLFLLPESLFHSHLFLTCRLYLSISLSLSAAAWCSVNRDWAWRYSTTRQDSPRHSPLPL